jgi:hypothetical protein
MWVKAREREKNKEKCVNGATFLTVGMVGGSPTVDVGEKLLLMVLLGDEVPIELAGIVPVSVSVEG